MSALRLVVIGASAGGLDALTRLLAQLPKDFPAPIFVVHHMAADVSSKVLVTAINKATQLECVEAKDGQSFKPGQIYLAPSDHHIMVGNGGKIMITKGARENRSRPGIDPLFRSAAVAYGDRVIGIILTGYLDDGTSGLSAIHRCGGVCIVQDPKDAAYPDMPANAIQQVSVDHIVPLSEIGAVLASLMEKKIGKRTSVPDDIVIEAKIAERVLSDLPSVEAVGDQVPFNCPGCGGVLWEIKKSDSLRYRCHTGHAYTASVLMAEQTAKIEETLWIALRMFEERRNLLTTMARAGTTGTPGMVRSSSQRAKEAEVHIKRIRGMLKTGEASIKA